MISMIDPKQVILAGVAILLVLGRNEAGEPSREAVGKPEIYQSLREVINRGAELYNNSGDHVGCYRMYQGALIALKPTLNPELQKRIDQGMTKAEQLATYSDRAFELRAVIDEIRAKSKPGISPPVVDKKIEESKADEKKVTPIEKKVEEKKVENKNTEDKIPDDKKVDDKQDNVPEVKKSANIGISGKLTLDGVPLEAKGLFLFFVSEDGRQFSTGVQKDGVFRLRTPLTAGKYRVHVEPFLKETEGLPELPERYRSTETTPILVEIRSGPQTVDIDLKK